MIGLEQSEEILKTTIYLEIIKIDIYTQAILSILYCINDNNSANIYSQALIRNRKTIEHLKLFQEKINTIINYKYCEGIGKLLIKKYTVYNLNLDWTILKSNTYILEEINKLAYKAFCLTYNNESRNIEFIYDFSEINSENPLKIKGNKSQQL